MSDSVNEDREQRKTTSMEESSAMTIEFLRARLLSERSVSKSARQRADELAKRVAELEEKLRFVSLQRKKAEKATADALANLENHGISDFSEEFNSCSDQEGTPCDFKALNGSLMIEVTSNNTKPRKNEMDTYSNSEVESSPSTGISLSWRSTKDSPCSLEKKYMDSVRRRASFTSNGLSARKVGKSCRRIRHRETRSVEELQNNGTEKGSCSMDASDGSTSDFFALRESCKYENGKNALSSTTLGSNSETRKMNGLYVNVHERDENIESALQHQAQLIGKYEEEEMAQREWEEKFRENNSVTQDSCDPGNHSDVTEERYGMKSPELSSRAAETSNSDNQEMKQELVNTCPQISKSLPSLSYPDKRSSHDEKCSSATIACESLASDFSFPTSDGKIDKYFSWKQHEASELRSQQYQPTAQTTTQGPTKTSSYEEKSMQLPASNRISSPLELAVVPQEPSNNLGSVLEALQMAKMSLNQKLNNSPQVSDETSTRSIQPSNAETNKVESFQIPFGTSGLFRLPTDYQFETDIDARQIFANFLPENTLGRFLSNSFVEPRSAFSGDLVLTSTPYRPFIQEIRPGISQWKSLGQPRLNEGQPSTSNRMNNPYTNPVLASGKDSYPFLSDVTLRLPLNGEGSSGMFPSSSERGLPSVMRLSSYDEHVRLNMYR